MAGFFREQGLRAVAVHSGDTSAPRAKSLEEVEAGHLEVEDCLSVAGVEGGQMNVRLRVQREDRALAGAPQTGSGLSTAEMRGRLGIKRKTQRKAG